MGVYNKYLQLEKNLKSIIIKYYLRVLYEQLC